MPSTPATTTLRSAGLAFVEHEYAHDPSASSYGLEAAAALGVEPGRVFKTLVVSHDTGLGVGVVPADRQLDLKAVAAALGVKKVVMAPPAQAERSSGYVVGGISPVGQKRRLPTVLDDSALGYATVFVSGGRRGFDIELHPRDLVTATGARTAAIAR